MSPAAGPGAAGGARVPPRPSAAARVASALGCALLALGCAGEAAPRPAPRATADPPRESVRPGINERFLDEELDVDHWVEVFEGESREVFAARDAIVRALALEPGMAVADVGAGTGLFLEPFARAVGVLGRVFAVEISPRFLEFLRARAALEGLESVRVVEGGERSASLPEGSVDLVFLCDTYHHFEYPAAMLESLHAALRPGGALVVVDFERVPGESPEWILEHVRAGRDVVRAEIEAAGFALVDEPVVAGLVENYVLRFRRSVRLGRPALESPDAP